MKKTMFDVLDKTPDGIDEETLEPAYNIDPEDVMKGVHSKLSADKKTGGRTTAKKSKRKAPIILAAAVISVLALGTLTVGALGGINSFIGEHSAGEMVNNLYPGSDVRVSTDSSMKGEFMGITGDDTNMVSLVRLTNADGSDIIEDGKDSFIESSDYRNYYDKTCKQFEEEVADIDPDAESSELMNLEFRKTKIWHTVGFDITDSTKYDEDAQAKISHSIWFRDPFDSPYPCFVSYEMADSKTINCYLSSHIDSGILRSLKGETLRAEDKNLYIYQIDKVLYKSDTMDDFARFELDHDRFNGLITDNISSLRDDQVITVHGYSMVIATRKEINIGLDVSAKLNYKSNTKNLPAIDTAIKGENGISYNITKINAGSLSTDVEISYSLPEGKKDFDIFTGLFPVDAKATEVTLKNGKVLNAQLSINHNYEEKHVITLTYCDNEDDNISQWVIVNPEEIKSISLTGTQITK